jgi:hypothetical protein
MNDDLKLPQVGELTLPRWQYWLARYNEVLSEKSDRIEKLETALRDLSDGWECCPVSQAMRRVARKALEGKDD